MKPLPPTRGRRRPAVMSRAPANAVEWRRVVYGTRLVPAAKLTVVCLGDFMDWRSGPGVYGRPTVERISETLGFHCGTETLGKHLSAAVQVGVLVVTSDPSPGRPCVYAASVPTGAAAPPAATTLPIDVPARHQHGGPARRRGPHPHEDAGVPFEHPHVDAVEHPHVDATYQREPSSEDQNQDPPTPRDRPLLALVPAGSGEGAESRVVSWRSSAPPPAPVVRPELVSAGLVGRLEHSMPARIAHRYERSVLVEVTRLMQGGWRIDDLIEQATEPSWHGVRDHGAVLLRRLRDMTEPPAEEPLYDAGRRPQCGRCDVNRQIELADGRMRRCPACHPLEVAESPF